MAGWERFEKSIVGSRETVPMVKIGKSGNILLNGLAMKLINHSEHVQLLYDRQLRRIGIKPCDAGALDAFKFTKSGSTGRQLNAKSYIKFFNLEELRGTKYRPRYEESMIVVNLNDLWDGKR